MRFYSRFLKRLSDTGWTPELVSAVAFSLLSPAIGVLMQTPRAIIYGAALGVTVLVWVIAIQLARSVSAPASTPGASPVAPSSTAAPTVTPPLPTPSPAVPPAENAPGHAPSSSPRPASTSPSSPVVIHGDVHGPLIISQGQQGGQVAHTINNYGPPKRALAPNVRTQMLATLRSVPASAIGFASTQGDIEAHEFKQLLMAVFTEAGWTVTDLQTFMFFGEQKGIILTIPFSAPEEGPVQTVAKALQLTGGPVQGNRGDMANDCGIYVQVWHAP